jgi:ADP-ribose pyrophosphatase
MGKIDYSNKFFKVEKNLIHTSRGKFYSYPVIQNDTVAIAAFTKDNKLILEKQYRHPIKKTIYEIPAGHIEKNENPMPAAKREFEEETGYKISHLQLLITTYPSPGIISNKEHIFLAKVSSKGKLKLDIDEKIKIQEVHLGKAISMIKSKQITDDKTIVAILYYKNFMQSK